MPITLNSPKLADPKSLAYQMHKKQQDRKRRKNPFVPELFERYFRRNEGTTDYATIPEVTLAGDFVIEFDFLPALDSDMRIMGEVGLVTNYIRYEGSTGKDIVIVGSGFSVRFSGTGIQLNTINTLSISRVGSQYSLIVNGGESILVTGSLDSIRYDSIYAGNSFQNVSGILANLKIYDNGTLIRGYPLDDNSDILRNRATVLGGDQAINPPSELGDGWTDNGDGSYTCDGSQSVGTLLRFTNAQFNAGDNVLTRFEIVSRTSGDIKVSIQGSTADGPSISSVGNYSHVSDITASTSTYGLSAGSTFVGTVRAISIRQADGYGTVINGNASDWGLFQQQATGEWLGQELATSSSIDVLSPDIESDPYRFWNSGAVISGLNYRCGLNIQGNSSAQTGWASNGGIPFTQPFHRNDFSDGFAGGDFISTASVNTQVFYRYNTPVGSVAAINQITLKEVLNVA